MKWLHKLGVAAIKVDFFGGDKQETLRLYEDILSDANDYGIGVIFHGCTIPRGWERMYPNYIGSEGALASENVFFTDHHARQEGFEMTMHPFSRNAIGSFDWGGVLMNDYMSKDNHSRHPRYTSRLFELATAITNQCSINCVAITPQADSVINNVERDFLLHIPVVEKYPLPRWLSYEVCCYGASGCSLRQVARRGYQWCAEAHRHVYYYEGVGWQDRDLAL